MTTGTFTYDDLIALPADELLRREIIGGELFEWRAPMVRHQVVSGELLMVIANYITAHGGAEIFIGPLDVILSPRDVVVPDQIVVTHANAKIVTEDNIRGAPDLVIEILDVDRHHAYVRKRDLYARCGVPRYWIVDPDADRIEVYVLDGDRYRRPQIFEPGDTLELDILQGLQIDVAGILRR